MADIYGSHFEFAGKLSRQYGLIIANIETSRFTQISGPINGVTIFNNKDKRRYLIDNDYANSSITFDVDIVTEPQRCLDPAERREIEKWLFNKREYSRFYTDSGADYYDETYEIVNGVVKRLYMRCRFANASKLEYNGGIVGYRATIESDSPFWWQDAITRTINVGHTTTSQTSVIKVSTDTDLDDYIYPKVTIKMGASGGDVIIINNTDSDTRQTKFSGLSASDIVIINGDTNYVKDGFYSKFTKPNFIRLLDGENSLTVQGNVSEITFEFSNRRAL